MPSSRPTCTGRSSSSRRLAATGTCPSFLQVSTDEVYGDVSSGFASSEDAPLRPSSPYPRRRREGTSRCSRRCGRTASTQRHQGSNTFGPYQYPEKMIPLFVDERPRRRPLPMYGDGRQTRDWLHVTTTARRSSSCWGGRARSTTSARRGARNLDLTQPILELAGPSSLIRTWRPPGHDRRYSVDCSRLAGAGLAGRSTNASGLARNRGLVPLPRRLVGADQDPASFSSITTSSTQRD